MVVIITRPCTVDKCTIVPDGSGLPKPAEKRSRIKNACKTLKQYHLRINSQ